jgi:hypothetical protein
MTSARTLTAIASAAAASFTVAGAHAATAYDAGLLSFESKAQSMWGSGDGFRRAESIFVGAEWSNRQASIGSITGSANALIFPGTPEIQVSPAIPAQTTPAVPPKLLTPYVPPKLITPAVYSPRIPATYAPRVCADIPFVGRRCTGGNKLTNEVPPKLIKSAIYSPALPATYSPGIPAITTPAIPAGYIPAVPPVYGDTRTGATIDVRSSGKVGLEFGYAIDSGSVDTSARFRANAQLPDVVKPAEFFSIQASSVFDKGTIATQSPKVEAHITPILQLSGTIDAKACGVALGCATSGPVALPTIDVKDQRLLSIDANSLKVLDGVLPGGKPLAEVPIANQTLTLEGGVTTTKPPVVGFNLNGPGGVTLITTLPPGVPTVTASLAEVTTTVPNIATAGATNAAPVTSSGRSDLLSVQIDLDALAAARGLMPPTGVGFDLISTGPFTLSASVDLIDADAGPVLGVTQAFEFKPTLMTTIRFSRPLQIGGLQGLHESWTGEWSELPQFAIDGTTTFSPTFWLDGVLSTDIGLDLGLVGTMELLKLGATASVGGVDMLNFSSLSLNDLLDIESTLFETPKVSFSVYGDSFDLEGFGAIAGQSFTIAVPEPSTYAMLLLGLGALGATARRRARERRDSVNTPQR